MMLRAPRWRVWGATAAVALFAVGCGGNGSAENAVNTATPSRTASLTPTATRTTTPTSTGTPTATATHTPSTAAVNVLVVVQRAVSAGSGDALGPPPEQWTEQPDGKSFDRALSDADWSVREATDKRGVTGPDGQFQISGLAPGQYTLQLAKTLDGNLAAPTIPFAVGDQGTATVVAQVVWGAARTTSTYTDGGAQVRVIYGPYGARLVYRDGRLTEFGDPSRTFTDPDGNGQFDVQPCIDHVWECSADRSCGDDRSCVCTASSPFVDDCGPGVCVPPGSVGPYRCTPGETCARPSDRCICVASCPTCVDCGRSVCVPDCVPVEITAITIDGSSQLVVGQQGGVRATALLSDGTSFDVTTVADWKSSEEAVATVDSWGTVSAVGVGSTALTATLGSLASAPWTIKVTDRPELRRIYIQNVSCFYPQGLPKNGEASPPVLAQPAQGDMLPAPNCGPVVQIDGTPVSAGLVVRLGGTIQFTALGEFDNGYYQDVTKEVTWHVAPPEIGSVVDGLFTAQQAGTTQLTASLGNVVSDATEIRVVEKPTVIELSIYPENGAFAVLDGGPVRAADAVVCQGLPPAGGSCCCPGPLAGDIASPCFECGYSVTVLLGDELKFRATAHYDTGEWQDVTDQVTWRSSDTAVATIVPSGVMTAGGVGAAAIDAVLDAVNSGPVRVNVVSQATLQFLSIYQEQGDRVVAKGDQRFFHAVGYYDIGFTRDVTKKVTWRTSDATLGSIDTQGTFTGLAAGTVQVWAELDGQQSDHLSLEVFETSELAYCDPAHINRAVWSDDFNRVTLESDCAEYQQPSFVELRYTVTETQPHGGIFDPCLDLYVFDGNTKVRTIREEGCGDPFLAAGAPNRDAEVLKYQLRAFWNLKDEDGKPVLPGTYTIYGRFYLYYDPVVSIDVTVLSPDGQPLPTRVPTATPGPVCTPPRCGPGEVLSCPRPCSGGCGTVCVPFVPPPTLPSEGLCYKNPPGAQCAAGAGFATSHERCCEVARFDASMLTISWCPADQIAASGQCGACSDDPCEGLPTPTLGPTAPPAPTPPREGVCFLGSPACTGPSSPTSRERCCASFKADDPDRPVSWCSDDQLDPTTLACDACTDPCAGLPTPTVAPPAPVPPTPEIDGGCFIGSANCTGKFFPTAQIRCCELFRFGGLPEALSWCPAEALDPDTEECRACASSPCEGLPTTAR